MTASKHGVLANLGMARKLGLGFALVLLLTLAVAAIGVASLYSVSQRFDSLRQMTQFNSDLLRLRQHEQGFALRSDSEEADKLRSGLQNLLERARGVPQLSATEADLSAYGQAFDAFVAARARQGRPVAAGAAVAAA